MPRPDVPVTLSIAITSKAPHELSRTTLTVIDLLLTGDLLRLRSEEVADTLHISPTTLRRRLRADGTHYQSILDKFVGIVARCSLRNGGFRVNASLGS
jgi:AraC-like DNA-binding protein